MTNEELTVKLLDKVGWDYDLLLNPGHYKSTKDLLAGELILAIFSTNSTVEAAKYLGIAYKTIVTLSPRFLQPVFGILNGGGETWKFRFLHELNLKYCVACKELLSYAEFHKDNSNTSGCHGYCKKCRVELNAEQYRTESTQEAHQRSYQKNYFKILERNQHYKGERALRVPKWSQTEQIIDFYSKCPRGMHVDHIVPLKGELVSGLHVMQNLQYLSAEENMQKGNRFEVD